jgi:hypothetical protein
MFGSDTAIMTLREDVDCDLYSASWSGSAWNATQSDVGAIDLSNYGAACPNQGTPAGGLAISYDFAPKRFIGWSRNWQFYSGSDTASTPTTSLGTEDFRITGFNRTNGIFRLRMNYTDRGRYTSNLDARKKLQYTTNCSPNSSPEAACTWTDVDDPAGAGIWRYKDLTCTPTDCADNTVIVGHILSDTSSGTCPGATDPCGTWVLDKDSASTNLMDMFANGGTSDVIQESEWIVEANGATAGTVYYFRIYNVEQDTPYYREQDDDDCSNNNTVGGNTCTYPSLLTDGVTVPTTADEMRHGNYFSGGSEQNFFFWTDY